MTNQTFSLYLPKGTIVLRDTGGAITLSADAHISGAVRQKDGGFRYTVGKHDYYACYGIGSVHAE